MRVSQRGEPDAPGEGGSGAGLTPRLVTVLVAMLAALLVAGGIYLYSVRGSAMLIDAASGLRNMLCL